MVSARSCVSRRGIYIQGNDWRSPENISHNQRRRRSRTLRSPAGDLRSGTSRGSDVMASINIAPDRCNS